MAGVWDMNSSEEMWALQFQEREDSAKLSQNCPAQTWTGK